MEISGIVETVNPWTSGKGYFMKIAGNELHGFGPAPCKPGDAVKIETGPGTGKFAGKLKVLKMEGLGSAIPEFKPASMIAPTSENARLQAASSEIRPSSASAPDTASSRMHPSGAEFARAPAPVQEMYKPTAMNLAEQDLLYIWNKVCQIENGRTQSADADRIALVDVFARLYISRMISADRKV